MTRHRFVLTACMLALVAGCHRPAVVGPGEPTAAGQADWPMWRADAARTAATAEDLPATLRPQWVRYLWQLEPAWPDEPRMTFDHAYAPVVAGTTMFVGSSRTDSLMAMDTATGDYKWRFFADGPIRFAPVVWQGKVYVASDDGCLYCLDAADGSLRWKFRGGPSERKVLGNGRLISTWPARGGPVVADGAVYFAAGIWPFMGVFVHALDAETGRVIWTNSGTGSTYMNQPHASPAFAGLAPQGYLVVVGDKLLVPNGRAAPACLDRRTGELLYFRLWDSVNFKRGNAHVAANSQYFVNDAQLFDLATGARLGRFCQTPVLTDEVVYCAAHTHDAAAARIEQVLTSRGEEEELRLPVFWDLPDGSDTLDRVWLKAGRRLYGSRGKVLKAVEIPRPGAKPRVVWREEIRGTPAGMIAAAGRLFVVTAEGGIHCYGKEKVVATIRPIGMPDWPGNVPGSISEWNAPAEAILRAGGLFRGFESPPGLPDLTPGPIDGYAVLLGLPDINLLASLAWQSRLHFIAVDPDGTKVAAARATLDAIGLYGHRVAVHVGDPATYPFPPYLASLVVAQEPLPRPSPPFPSPSGRGSRLTLPSPTGRGEGEGRRFVEQVFRTLRPYGGTALLSLNDEEHADFARQVGEAKLPNAEVTRTGDPMTTSGRSPFTALRRVGALPGAADWTHQYADAANTVVSKDRLVKLPLGLLWFGGSSNATILPRHGHGPTPQVVAGRIIVEGPDSLRAMDLYTGRVLWEADLPGLGKFYDTTDHQPGANALGSNYVSTEDGIYVAYGTVGLRLDPATGRTLKEFKLAVGPEGRQETWGYLGLSGHILLVGLSPQGFWDPDFAPGEFTDRRYDPHHLPGLAAWVRSFKDFRVVEPRSGEEQADFVARNLNALMRERSLFEKLPGQPRNDLLSLRERIEAYLARAGRLDEQDLRLRELNRALLEQANWALPRKERETPGGQTWTGTSSRRLAALDRHTGEILWTLDARLGVRHNAIAIGGGRVFCIDRYPEPLVGFWRWRGEPEQETARLLALDARTGRALWGREEDVFGTWLGYSEEYDVVLEARRPSRDMLDEAGRRLAALRGATGEVLWERRLDYQGPCLLHDRTIFTQDSALDLLTGQTLTREHPITGIKIPWAFQRQYGCNTVIGASNLLTFRSAAAGFFDLAGDGGTGNFGGFKSGCTSNLIPAGGVLAAPDYTRTCICSYQNQTSLALVHDPEVEEWTFNAFDSGSGSVRRVGLNFGAPGDRRAEGGTLWLDCPSVGGPSPDLPVRVEPATVTYFRRHSTQVAGEGLRWVAASGVVGVRSVTITLTVPPSEAELKARAGGRRSPTEVPPRPSAFTLRLHFLEPEGRSPGERVFDVAVQGQTILAGLDVAREAGGPNRPLVKEVTGVKADADLTLTFTPADTAPASVPVLCGIEVLPED